MSESEWFTGETPKWQPFTGGCDCSPLDDPGKKKFRCTPRGTKVVIYHLVGNFMLNSMQYVVSLATCAESL